MTLTKVSCSAVLLAQVQCSQLPLSHLLHLQQLYAKYKLNRYFSGLILKHRARNLLVCSQTAAM